MLIVVRHGQSVANLEGKYAGHYNAPLTDSGRLQAEKSAEYVAEKYAKDYNDWVDDLSKCRPTGGESVKELYERVALTTAFEKLAKENVGKTAYVATHGTPIRVLMAETSGAGLKNLKDVPWASNASLTFIDYKNGKLVAEKIGFDERLGEMRTYLPKGV